MNTEQKAKLVEAFELIAISLSRIADELEAPRLKAEREKREDEANRRARGY